MKQKEEPTEKLTWEMCGRGGGKRMNGEKEKVEKGMEGKEGRKEKKKRKGKEEKKTNQKRNRDGNVGSERKGRRREY